jgi:hypothetical protein
MNDLEDRPDPEFGSEANAALVVRELQRVKRLVDVLLGNSPPPPIVEVAGWPDGDRASDPVRQGRVHVMLNEKQLRLIQFALGRCVEEVT